MRTNIMFKLRVENNGDWLCFSLCTSVPCLSLVLRTAVTDCVSAYARRWSLRTPSWSAAGLKTPPSSCGDCSQTRCPPPPPTAATAASPWLLTTSIGTRRSDESTCEWCWQGFALSPSVLPFNHDGKTQLYNLLGGFRERKSCSFATFAEEEENVACCICFSQKGRIC